MKSADIEAILDVNPNARFARVPTGDETHVRYLALLGRIEGLWTVQIVGTPAHFRLSARDICPAEEAEAKVAATIERNAANYARNRRAEQVAEDLAKAGVPARAVAGRIIVHSEDVEALATLLLGLDGE